MTPCLGLGSVNQLGDVADFEPSVIGNAGEISVTILQLRVGHAHHRRIPNVIPVNDERVHRIERMHVKNRIAFGIITLDINHLITDTADLHVSRQFLHLRVALLIIVHLIQQCYGIVIDIGIVRSKVSVTSLNISPLITPEVTEPKLRNLICDIIRNLDVDIGTDLLLTLQRLIAFFVVQQICDFLPVLFVDGKCIPENRNDIALRDFTGIGVYPMSAMQLHLQLLICSVICAHRIHLQSEQ